ncbi:MAG: AarF/ABC1/UbiB kinase family protein [Candidatus Nanohaloarchaea archaeon]|nr:AarF/ABC1/UbiB kinase family protein [Candidatus Nanohaloarchaea archaeon]
MGVIQRQVEDVKRLEEILTVLSEEGFGFVLGRLKLGKHVPFRERVTPTEEVPPPERVRRTFEELGPTFIKFGQVLAQRPDIVPEEYITELEKLEDAVPAFPGEEARRIVEEELGPIDETFAEFEDEPLAAASIAQVHRATLQDGEEVVVKVRRPGIKEQMEKDLDILQFMAREGEKHVARLKAMEAHSAVTEFARWTRNELDLRREARNAQILQSNLADEERVTVPDVYMDLTTEKVLVMEYVDGVKSNDAEALAELDIDAEEVARTAVRAGLKQTIRDGFFHADPHPSNFLISEDGQIIYLDFGMMGKLTASTRRDLGLLLLHAANEEVDAAVDVVKRMARLEEDADIEGLKEDIEESILLIRDSTLEEQSITRALFDIAVQASHRGVHMPSSLVILGKSMVTMEGIGLTIYPEFEMTEEFERITERLLFQMNSPKKLARTAMIDLLQNRDLLLRLPSQLQKLIDGVGGGRSREVVQVESPLNTKSILAGALILSSSLLLLQSLPQRYMLAVGVLELLAAGYLLLR